MFDFRILFALILAGLLMQSGSPARSSNLPVLSAVAPIEVEPETRN